MVGTRTGASHTSKIDSAVNSNAGDISIRSRELTVEPCNDPNQTTDDSNRLFGSMNHVVSSITKLENLGLSKLEHPIPKCVVLGEQSTGKSSVIEAISGIRTPRSSGTCTRCPLLIQLKPSDEANGVWSAKVTLRKQFKFDGKKSKPGEVREFEQWLRLEALEIVEFGEAFNLDDLEELIQCAQRAMIHPLSEHHVFLPNSTESYEKEHRTDFSPNVVGILVTHSSLPPLSLYDLPGIISRAEKKEAQFSVKVVRDMVSEYVRDPQSLVLVTCSFGNDIACSSAYDIVDEEGAEGRCIGILTKPDRDEGTSVEALCDIFDGKSLELGHGYFVVKNPNQHEMALELTHEQAREREMKFFRITEPWAKSLNRYSSRFGIANLQDFLSKKLAEMMIQQLPGIDEEINARLIRNDEALAECPMPPQNAVQDILEALQHFADHVRKDIECDFDHNAWEWQNAWKALRITFLESLLAMAPKVNFRGPEDSKIFDKVYGLRGMCEDESILISDDEDDQPLTTSKRGNSAQPIPATPSKKRKMGEDVQFKTPTKTTPGRPRAAVKRTPSQAVVTPSKSDHSPTEPKIYYLNKVETELGRKAFHKAPNDIEPRVVCSMMVDTLQNCRSIVKDFFTEFEMQMKSHMRGQFHKQFSQWRQSPLYDEAWAVVESMMDTDFKEQRASAKNNLDDEKEGPFISNEKEFEVKVKDKLKRWADKRNKQRIDDFMATYFERNNVDKISQPEWNKVKDSHFFTDEPYAKVLETIAKTTTYYSIAARRLHEAICMRIVSKFFVRLRHQLQKTLISELGITDEEHGHENARRLLAEPETMAIQRQQLHNERSKLLKAQAILHDLKSKGATMNAEMMDWT